MQSSMPQSGVEGIHGTYCPCGVTDLVILYERYCRTRDYWYRHPQSLALQEIFKVNILPFQDLYIDNVVCFSLGSMTRNAEPLSGRGGPVFDCYAARRLFQLVALESWVQFLRKHYPIEYRVYIQDPAFTKLDKAFIEQVCGFTVLDDPIGWAVINSASFLFTPFSPIGITYSLLYVSHPAILVGCNLSSTSRVLPENEWILLQRNIQAFFAGRNFKSLGMPVSLWARGHGDAVEWLDQMNIFYPILSPNPNGLNDRRVKHYNESNHLLKQWYATTPTDMTLEQVMKTTSGPDWIETSVGLWTEAGFTFYKDYNDRIEEFKSYAEVAASRLDRARRPNYSREERIRPEAEAIAARVDGAWKANANRAGLNLVGKTLDECISAAQKHEAQVTIAGLDRFRRVSIREEGEIAAAQGQGPYRIESWNNRPNESLDTILGKDMTGTGIKTDKALAFRAANLNDSVRV